MIRLVVVGFLFMGSLSCFSQDTRSTGTSRAPSSVYQKKNKSDKTFLFFKKKKKTQVNEVAEFRARLQKVYKQKAKEERLAEKPRYSDPSYFGHKKPPKKRPVGKQKFCKICKIKH